MKKIYLLFLSLLIMHNVYADYITNDILGGCDVPHLHSVDNITDMFPIFTINQYTCQSGEFLPAYTLGCRSCPSGYTCSGGTFIFNDTVSQGIQSPLYITQSTQYTCAPNLLCSIENETNMIPVFTPNQHTCGAGYYMPANYDGCQLCPENNYCPGGTYTFNETTPQGITACAQGTFAPEGMWEVAQCGRIFHVGDDVVYLRAVRKTEHALNFDMDMDGVADYFANMTPLSVPMHINSAHGLKINLDGVEYSVYDDTVDLGLYENNPFVPAQ